MPVQESDNPIITKRLDEILGPAPAVPVAVAPAAAVAAPAGAGAPGVAGPPAAVPGVPGPPAGGPAPAPVGRRINLRTVAALAPAPPDPVSKPAAAAQNTLGLAHRQLRVVRVPDRRTLDEAFATYGNDNVTGLDAAELARMSMRGLLGIPNPALQPSGAAYPDGPPTALQYIRDHFGDGGYEARERLVLVAASADNKAVVHEIGHFHQHVEGGLTEAEVPNMLLEYHNVVLNENRAVPDDKPEQLRKQYNGTLALRPVPDTSRWADLRADLRDMPPAATHALDELEKALRVRRKYSVVDEERIKSNLLEEYFAAGQTATRERIKAAHRH